MKVEEIHMRARWRILLAVDLGLFNLALFLFALLPPYNLIPQEWVAMGLAVFAMIGVITHALPLIHLPGERWAYMITSWVGLYVLVAYEKLSSDPYYMKVSMAMFLLSGIASAYAAHVIDGGPRAVDGHV